MASPIPTSHCRVCGVDLTTVKRSGARCMKCYYNDIKQKRVALKRKAVEYGGGRCHDCGGVFPDCCFDFHHTDGSKDDCVGKMTHNYRPWKVIEEELNKCVMLCANCHRIRHFNG